MLSAWKPIGDRQSVIQPVAEWARDKNIYINVGLRHPTCQGTKYIRGKEQDVWVLPGLWADFDHAGGVHAARDLPGREELLAFLQEMPFRWSLIIDTGGGFHAYLLFREPWVLETAPERTLAAAAARLPVHPAGHVCPAWLAYGYHVRPDPRLTTCRHVEP